MARSIRTRARSSPPCPRSVVAFPDAATRDVPLQSASDRSTLTRSHRMNTRRRLIAGLALAMAALATALRASGQARKDSVVLGMVLEPTGLDPTAAPAAA